MENIEVLSIGGNMISHILVGLFGFGIGMVTAFWIVLMLFRFAMKSTKKIFKPPTPR